MKTSSVLPTYGTTSERRVVFNAKFANRFNHDGILPIMKWITREKVKVGRVACLWLIERFIDPRAERIFVPANQVDAKGRDLGATPYDIEGCELGHHDEDVSFDSIL